jgi:hypothetical protein
MGKSLDRASLFHSGPWWCIRSLFPCTMWMAPIGYSTHISILLLIAVFRNLDQSHIPSSKTWPAI